MALDIIGGAHLIVGKLMFALPLITRQFRGCGRLRMTDGNPLRDRYLAQSVLDQRQSSNEIHCRSRVDISSLTVSSDTTGGAGDPRSCRR